jgi:type IV pilus assembly protein PilN
MPQINLLPWREELRQRRQKEFGVIALVAVLLMAGVVGLVHMQFSAMIDFQGQRNQFLEQQIAALDKKIKDIKTLEEEKERLIARMKIIQSLQSGRPEVVHLFDELVATMPEGVFYNRIIQRDRNLSLEGVAQSNARVSSLMRGMDGSTWLTSPRLDEIKAQAEQRPGQQELRINAFKMSVQQAAPKKEEDEAPKGARGRAR